MSSLRGASLLAVTLGAIAFEGCAPGLPGSAATSKSSLNAPIPPRIRWVQRPGSDRVAVEVLDADPEILGPLGRSKLTPEQWSSFFSIVVADDSDLVKKKTPILGSYKRSAELAIVFEPRFPLEPGLKYRAEFNPVQLYATVPPEGGGCSLCPIPWEPRTKKIVVSEFSLSARAAEATTSVAHVYPSRDELPENLLRFYVHFSAPMSRGEVYERVHLLDASGIPLESPFLELAEELWDPSGIRLTLQFDPGRIKKGLKPREEVGPILEAGKKYSLVIDRGWPDAQGNPLTAEYRKAFTAVPADETSPDPKSWKIHAPAARSREPLEVTFPESLHHAMLGRVLAVTDARTELVQGQIEIDRGETRWRFTPDVSWTPGPYALVVDQSLEDLAGNNITRPFEVDVFQKVERRATVETITLPFNQGESPPTIFLACFRVFSVIDLFLWTSSRARVAQPVVETRWA